MPPVYQRPVKEPYYYHVFPRSEVEKLDTKQTKTPPALGEGFPQILHDRSRAAGTELHKLLISLSTGTLAIYFLALTGEAKPPLSKDQKFLAIASVACVALAATSGILSMYADVRRFYLWGSALQAEDKTKRTALYKERDRWITRDRWFAPTMGVFFIIGMLTSVIYGALRILGK
jgi:hypothetical protein